MKTCLKCGLIKEYSEYHAKRGKPQPQCKACRSKYMAKLYLDNREREIAKHKAWYEKNKSAISIKGKKERAANPEKHKLGRRIKKYGLSKCQYENMLTEQNNSCAICLRPFGIPYIDHCHDSGLVRALLCSQCNTGFGLLQEDVAIFRRCIAYANKYKKFRIKSLSDNSQRGVC